MSTEKGAKVKAKAHRIYRNKAGKRVCGVTTYTNVLNKPALVGWANRLGLEGIEVGKYVDTLAGIGTLAHKMLNAFHCGIELGADVLDHYSKNDISRAENAVLSYHEWAKPYTLETIAAELPLVSEKWNGGGTMDWYGKKNVVKTLIDYKTGSGIFPEHIIQVSTYAELLEEHGYPVEDIIILRIPRAASETFEVRRVGIELRKVAFELFLHCVEIYRLQKLMRGGF